MYCIFSRLITYMDMHYVNICRWRWSLLLTLKKCVDCYISSHKIWAKSIMSWQSMSILEWHYFDFDVSWLLVYSWLTWIGFRVVRNAHNLRLLQKIIWKVYKSCLRKALLSLITKMIKNFKRWVVQTNLTTLSK